MRTLSKPWISLLCLSLLLSIYLVRGVHSQATDPTRRPPSPPAADRFPVTHKSGDLELTLGPVQKGNPRHFLQNDGQGEIYGAMAQPPAGYRAAPGEERRRESPATFTFRGRPTTHWMLTGLDAAMWDASGKARTPDLLGAGHDRLAYLAPDSGEPFRLRVSARQQTDADFVPDRIWSANGVVLPEPRSVTLLNTPLPMENVDLKLLGIAGAGVQSIRPVLFAPIPAGYVAVVLSFTHKGSAPDIALKVADSQGHSIAPSYPPEFPNRPANTPWITHYGGVGSTDGYYLYLIKVPQPDYRVDLTFGLNKPYFFEFVMPSALQRP